MQPSSLIAMLDANVLYPFTLRDTLLRAVAAGLFQARWLASFRSSRVECALVLQDSSAWHNDAPLALRLEHLITPSPNQLSSLR